MRITDQIITVKFICSSTRHEGPRVGEYFVAGDLETAIQHAEKAGWTVDRVAHTEWCAKCSSTPPAVPVKAVAYR